MNTKLYPLVRRLKIEKNGNFLIKEKLYGTYLRYYNAIMVLNGRVILRKRGEKFRYTREELGLKPKRKKAWYKAIFSKR